MRLMNMVLSAFFIFSLVTEIVYDNKTLLLMVEYSKCSFLFFEWAFDIRLVHGECLQIYQLCQEWLIGTLLWLDEIGIGRLYKSVASGIVPFGVFRGFLASWKKLSNDLCTPKWII